jgi:hypothetical protein
MFSFLGKQKRFTPISRDRGIHQILFIHGLAGSAIGTWGTIFSLIESDEELMTVSADCYTFPTSLTQIFTVQRRPGVRELADGLRTHIEFHHPDCTNLYLVAHSLGGLVVRQFLLDIMDSSLANKISGALLFAVPNSGSDLARFSDSLSWKNIQAKQLIPNSDFILGLNREWTRRAVESRFNVEYVVGGLDKVVPLESSAWSQTGKVHTIIEAGHRSIVKPGTNAETAFKILKKFISTKLDVYNNEEVESIEVVHDSGDPLFTSYTTRNEAYYLERAADLSIKAALESSHVWISGPAGVGKTVALQRAIHKRAGDAAHIMLSGHGSVGPVKLVAAILTSLYERVGQPDTLVDDNDALRFGEHVRSITNLIGASRLTVLIEEIPLKPEEFYEFLELIYHILLASGLDARIRWVFSSIHQPPMVLPEGKAHLLEQVQFLTLGLWSQPDITKLVNIILRSGALKLSRLEKSSLISNSSGNPRIVKMVMRRRRFVTEQKLSIIELISAVKVDLGQ